MKNLCYSLLIAVALFSLAAFTFGDDCKSYCDGAFAAAQEQDRVINQKAREISQTCMMLEINGIEGVTEIGCKLQDVHPEYVDAKKTLGVATFLLDFTKAFEAAGVTVPGYTYENAAKIATAGKNQLDAVEAKLDAIAEELRAIIDEPDKAA